MTALATRARLTVVAVIAGLMMTVGAAAPPDTTDLLIQIDERLTSAVDEFGSVYSDQAAELGDIVSAAQTFKTAAETAKNDFSNAAKSTGDGTLAGFANDLAGTAGDMASAADTLATAFTAQDQAAAQQGENDLNAAFDAYGKTVDKYNEYLKTAGDPSFTGWLIVLIIAIVLLVLALIFALVTRKQEGLLAPKTDKKGNVSQASLKKMRWMVVLWAAVFAVGAAIPFFQVITAQPDASGQYTYTVFWYPLVIGAVLSVVSVIQYFIAASKVKKQGSAVAYDPADPSTHGVPAQGANYVPVPQYVPGAPVPPAPPAPPVAGAAPVADAPAAEAGEVPAAPGSPADPADPAAPAAPGGPQA